MPRIAAFAFAGLLAAAPALAQQAPRPAPAPAAIVACPASVQAEGGERLRPPPGWEVRPELQRHWLRGADLFEGDPAERVQLRPERDPRSRQDRWDLGAMTRPYWLVCRYEGLESGLMIALPPAVRHCDVSSIRENSRGMRHGRVVSGPEQVRVACR